MLTKDQLTKIRERNEGAQIQASVLGITGGNIYDLVYADIPALLEHIAEQERRAERAENELLFWKDAITKSIRAADDADRAKAEQEANNA